MTAFWDVLIVTIPFFGLVACGFTAAMLGGVPLSAIPGLNRYVLYYALPAMLFEFSRATPIGALFLPQVALIYALAALSILALVMAGLWRRWGRMNAAFAALVAAFPNSGFMGIPLLLALLGDKAIGALVASLLVDLCLVSSLSLAIALGGRNLGAFVRAPLANPMPWAILLGAGYSALQTHEVFALPEPILHMLSMLASSASPVALFTMGVVLWRSLAAGQEAAPWSTCTAIALVKLIIHPAMIALLSWHEYLGRSLTPIDQLTLILIAALPCASNVSLLTERFGANTGLVARIILVSTVLAFISFSFIAYLLMPLNL